MKKLLAVIFLLFAGLTAFAETKEGSAPSFKDDIHVIVEMEGETIVSIQVKHNDPKRIADPVIEKLTKEVIEKQSTNIDDVAGATYTSKGFRQAVFEATGK